MNIRMETVIMILLTGAVLLLAAALIFLWMQTSKTLDRVEEMLDAALNGCLTEEHYSEQKLSKIEAKLFRYLAAQERAQNNVRKEKDAVKALVSDISHQTKTPIANILLYTQLLKEQAAAEGDTEEKKIIGKAEDGCRENKGVGYNVTEGLVTQIEEQTEKLNFLIQSLVKLSRLENGIVALHPARNEISPLLDVTEYRQAAIQKGVRLLVEEQAEKAEITAVFDRKWTKEAVGNLVENAIKYTPAGGCVTLSAAAYEMFVRIDIRDTGIGMTEEETARIFTRFYRSPRVGGEKGVGIGLYLVREILSKENGYIKVRSRLGQGSVFSVFLPRQEKLSKL